MSARVAIIEVPEVAVRNLPVGELALGVDVRLDDDPEQLSELAASIAELGVLQPLVVSPRGRTFEVVAGRRRLSAARQAGLDAVPCIVRELSEDERLDVAIAENLHRRNLSAIELALGYAEMKRRGATQTDIARKIGRTQAHVSQVLTLLTFPDDVQQAIHHGDVSYMNVLTNRGRFRDGMPPPRSAERRQGQGSQARARGSRRRGDVGVVLASPPRSFARRAVRAGQGEAYHCRRMAADRRSPDQARRSAVSGRVVTRRGG